MKRRSFLGLLAATPVAAVAAKLPRDASNDLTEANLRRDLARLEYDPKRYVHRVSGSATMVVTDSELENGDVPEWLEQAMRAYAESMERTVLERAGRMASGIRR